MHRTEVKERITSKPNVCFGDACVDGTRIPVWGLAVCRRGGLSDKAILKSYPSLSQADLDAAWVYIADHPEEIERQIADVDSTFS